MLANKMSVQMNIEDRKRKVRALLAEGNNEVEIAKILRVAQPTISRDVTALKEDSRNYIYDLAKTDLAYSYQNCIDSIDGLISRSWRILNQPKLDIKDQMVVMRLIKDCTESKFSLFQNGPIVLNSQTQAERLSKIESKLSQNEQGR